MRLLRLANTTTRDSLSLTIVTTSASSQSVNGITGSENNSGEKKNHSSPNLLSLVPKEKNHLCMTDLDHQLSIFKKKRLYYWFKIKQTVQ
jgi:hypothetical protein